ncbi:MAG: Enoyl-CoA hydratase [Solirubrobacterales bacterium]|nr:Enoyl-CoA hydratase [Solirubrobacterales bacterium]
MSIATPARLGVVGAGTMGAGIAGLAARCGLVTTLFDIAEAPLAIGRERIDVSLDRAVAKRRVGADDAAAARARLTTTTALADLVACEVIIEAAPERADLKGELLARLAEVAPGAVLASNTSSIAIADLAERSGVPRRVVGLHFFNPPAAMPLVELVATARTDASAVARARALAEALGKDVVDVSDGPGFLVNRCARPYYLEALRIVEDGAATFAQVDRVCVEDGGFPLGPFELMDVIGVDVSLAVTRSMWEQSFGEPRWRPSPLQVRLVGGGRLGRKTGGGFYEAGAGWADLPAPAPAARTTILDRILAQLVNEAAFAVTAGVASAAEIDRAMVVGLSHPRGPGAWASLLGHDRVIATLDDLWTREHDPRYRVAPGLRRAAAAAVGIDA